MVNFLSVQIVCNAEFAGFRIEIVTHQSRTFSDPHSGDIEQNTEEPVLLGNRLKHGDELFPVENRLFILRHS